LFQDFKKLWCNLELDVIDTAIGPRKKRTKTKMRTIAICVQFVCGTSDESYTGRKR